MSKVSLHRWRFFRAGGFDQVDLASGTDLTALDQLDQKLWAALACPTKGLEFDDKTLAFLDHDGDGRIRAPELLAAARWAGSVLTDPEALTAGAATLPLSAIDEKTDEGKTLKASARQILINLGKSDAEAIAPEDTADPTRIFADSRFNGDGIVPADSADDDALKGLIETIIETVGSAIDRSGEPGINEDHVAEFYGELEAHAEWRDKGEHGGDSVLPFGDQTEKAAATYERLRAKVDDYFTRCQLADYDSRAAEPLNPTPATYEALATENLAAAGSTIAEFPLAKIEPDKPLPLSSGANPAWSADLAAFRSELVQPLFGDREALTADEWRQIEAKLAAYETWQAEKKGPRVEHLGIERVRELLTNKSKERLLELIAADRALADEAEAIDAVDRLTHYHRDLFRLANNFVSLRDFYSPDTKAIFQSGTLYIDGRSFDLCVEVDDVAKHAALAARSRTYLLYLKCTRKGEDGSRTIAAAVTDGDSDNLMVGRNGVFYDRDGDDWDATVIRIVDQPISVRQAFWAPFKKIAAMIGDQIEKFAAARDKATTDQAGAGIAATSKKVEAGDAAGQAFDVGKFAGIFAAIGLAIGAIGTAMAAVMTGLLGLSAWQMPLAIVGGVLAISGPSMLIAYLKLRRRTLAPILDANGWAVNSEASINIPFGASLTSMAALPKGAKRSYKDPYPRKGGGGRWLLAAVLALAAITAVLWQQGRLQPWLGQVLPASVMERLGVAPDEATGDTAAAAATDEAATPAAAPATTEAAPPAAAATTTEAPAATDTEPPPAAEAPAAAEPPAAP